MQVKEIKSNYLREYIYKKQSDLNFIILYYNIISTI
jgi:hypothetical protein